VTAETPESFSGVKIRPDLFLLNEIGPIHPHPQCGEERSVARAHDPKSGPGLGSVLGDKVKAVEVV